MMSCVFLLVDWIKVIWLVLSVTSLTCCFGGRGFGCSQQGFADCQEVDVSECHEALSGPHNGPHGRQLQTNMAANFMNLTIMVDTTSTPGTHTRYFRLVLTHWLGVGDIKLKQMMMLMTGTDESSPWSSCGRIALSWDKENIQEESLTTLIPIHPNMTSYRMTAVSTYQDKGGQLDIGHTQYLIKMADFESSQDWVLPVIAHAEIQDRVVFSLTPPSPRIHRNLLKCDTWLITCGRRRNPLAVTPEEIEPDAPFESGVREAEEWGMGNCMYYENELLLKSSPKFPILNMKVAKGEYQLWIDCVLQNPMTTWPSTTRTIRTPTFTHSGDDEFFINIQWKQDEKRHDLPIFLKRHSLFPEMDTSSHSHRPESNPGPAATGNNNNNSSSEKMVIVAGCLVVIGPLMVGIGAFIVYKYKTKTRKGDHAFFREDSCDEKTKALPSRSATSPSKCPHSCFVIMSKDRVSSTDGSITTQDEHTDTTTGGSSSFASGSSDTQSLHTYSHMPVDITRSYSADANVNYVDKDHYDDEEDEEAKDGVCNDDDDGNYSDVPNSEVVPLQMSSNSKQCKRIKPPILHDGDNYKYYINYEKSSNNFVSNNGKEHCVIGNVIKTNREPTIEESSLIGTHRHSPEENNKYLSNINDNSSSLGYHSYNQQLAPIKQPKFLTADVRTDSVNFNDFLHSFNSTATDWRLGDNDTG